MRFNSFIKIFKYIFYITLIFSNFFFGMKNILDGDLKMGSMQFTFVILFSIFLNDHYRNINK